MTEIPLGARAELAFTVTEADTAIALGSGDVPVLATPRAIAWAEAATVAAVAAHLEPGETTVGSAVAVRHLAATQVGESVRASADVTATERRRIEFSVTITNPDGAPALTGSISRVRVDRERFAG